MRLVRFPIREAAAASLLLMAGAMGLAPAVQASDLARPQSGLVLALVPLSVSGKPSSYADSGAETAVRVTTDKSRYQRGETVLVTLRNELSAAIYAPPPGGPTPCAVIIVQKLEAGGWMSQTSCEPGLSVVPITIAANNETTGLLTSALQGAVNKGPYVSPPTAPFVFEGDLRDLPPVEPSKPGEPVREIPQLQVPEVDRAFKVLSHPLSSGTYRIALDFTVGTASGAVRTAYSEPFHVVG
jgi:hypothetical protein